MFTINFFLLLYPKSKHTHLKIMVIQIQSFELLRILNSLKHLIIPSKYTISIIFLITSIFNVYYKILRYIHRVCTEKKISDVYGFMDPSVLHCLPKNMLNTPQTQNYILQKIQDEDKLCYMAPYIDLTS
jgi:hypothetical protein